MLFVYKILYQLFVLALPFDWFIRRIFVTQLLNNFADPCIIMPKKNVRKKERASISRTLVYAIEGESVYGQILLPMGNGRFQVSCADAVTRIARVCGRLNKRVWIQQHDFVLVSLREEDNRKGDIVLKYLPPEIKILRESQLIPESFTNDDVGTVNLEFENI